MKLENEEEQDEYLSEFQKECEKYGYSVCKNLYMYKIQTKYEHWYCVIQPDEKIKLMHLCPWVTLLPGQTEYHKHFCRHISIHDLILYIHEHELAKFTAKVINFHFTREGERIRE